MKRVAQFLHRMFTFLLFITASDVAGESSASMAAASMVFRHNGDEEYANILLAHAIDLYNFAITFRGLYSDSFPEVKDFYK